MKQPRTSKNDPTLAGKPASPSILCGAFHRYRLQARHTRFERVEWALWDAEVPDEETGLLTSCVGQWDTFEAACAAIIGAEL